MELLIDTQVLIWSFDRYSPLSIKHKELLEDGANSVFVSQISLMEISIKKNINKLPDFVPDLRTVTEHILATGFELLPLKNEHIFTYQNLPIFQEHKDPFDRFLIAIAIHENLKVVTTDEKFKLYAELIQIV